MDFTSYPNNRYQPKALNVQKKKDTNKTIIFVIVAVVIIVILVLIIEKVKKDKKHTVSPVLTPAQKKLAQDIFPRQVSNIVNQVSSPQSFVPAQVMQASTNSTDNLLPGTQSSLDNFDQLFAGAPFADVTVNDPTQQMAANQMTAISKLMPSNWDSQTAQAAGVDQWAPNVMNKQGYDKFVKASGDFRYAMIDRPLNTWGKGGIQMDKGWRPAPRIVMDPNESVPFNDSTQRLDIMYNMTGQYPSLPGNMQSATF